jgi:palmitoyltransferase
LGMIDEVTLDDDNAMTSEKIFSHAKMGKFEFFSNSTEYEMIISSRDTEGHTVLHWGCLFGNVGFVRKACEVSADYGRDEFINAKSRNGQTAFMWSALKGNIDCMKILYQEFGANINVSDSLGADAIILAVQHHQHVSMLLLWKWLSDGGWQTCDHMGCTAVHWAAYKGDILALRLLEYCGADMNSVDNTGMTPLHRAVGEGWNEVVEFLVTKCRSDVNLTNHKGESAVDIAKRLENKLMLKILLPSSAESLSDNSEGRWILPLAFVVCMSIVVISFMTLNQGESTFSSAVFVGSACISILMFSFLVTGDPGVVPKRSRGKGAIEEWLDELDNMTHSVYQELAARNGTGDLSRICHTCWEWKNLRTKHCSICNVCVDGFDHHCGWLNNCVASKNHRQFVLMILATFSGSFMYLWVTIGAVVRGYDTWSVYDQPLLIPGWVINFVICPWLGLLVFYQLRSISLNINTNEMINMHRYEHFWDGPLTVTGVLVPSDGVQNDNNQQPVAEHETHGPECQHNRRRFRNPFDRGSIIGNCMQFWFPDSDHQQTRKYQPVPKEIELAEYV